MPGTHARLSPSKRHRWSLCAASVREEAKILDEQSASAKDGSDTHALLEWCLKQLPGVSSFQFLVGCTSEQHGITRSGEPGFIISNERLSRVQVAIDYIKSRLGDDIKIGQIITEQRVEPLSLVGRDDLGGTVDVQLIGKDFLEIIDYKDGMGIVEVQNNPQLRQYAIGVLARYHLSGHLQSLMNLKVRLTVIQPKLVVKRMPPVSHWDTTVYVLLQDIPLLIKEAAATDDPNAPFIPGDVQCKFCKYRGKCPALVNEAVRGVSENIDSLTQDSANKNPEELTNDQIREILESAPLLRQMLEGVEKEALRRLRSGDSIPGFKLVKGRGHRKWSLPDEEIAEKLIKMGAPKTSVFETSVISVASAEKLTWVKKDGTSKSLSDKQLNLMRNEYVVTSEGKLTVVPESDSRPAVIGNVASLFNAIEPESEIPDWLK